MGREGVTSLAGDYRCYVLDVAGPLENSPANGRRENGLDNEFTARLLHDDSDVADRSAESARLLGKPSTQDPLLGEFGPECHASRSGSRKTLADRKSTRLKSSH